MGKSEPFRMRATPRRAWSKMLGRIATTLLVGTAVLSAARLLVAQVANDESAIPAKIEAFLKLCETSRRGAILKLEHQLRGLEQAKNPSAAAKEQINAAREQLRLLRANESPVVPPLAFPLQTGAIGRLPDLAGHVDQILGPEELLVRCQFSLKVVTIERFRPRAETVVQTVPLLVRGISTTGFQEGADVTLADVFEVTPKERLARGNGKLESVQVLTKFDLQAIMPSFRRMKQRAQ